MVTISFPFGCWISMEVFPVVDSFLKLYSVPFFIYYSSRKVISFSTTDAFLKLGRILPSFTLMQRAAGVTMIHWMFAKLAPELSSAVVSVL